MGQHSACLSEDDDDNIKASQTSQPTPTSQRTPTPKMTRCTPKPSRPTHSRSRHSQGSTVSATDDAFPDTMQPIKEELFQWERNHFITLKVLDLLHKMLCFESEERFLVSDVLRHPWLSLYFNKYKGQMLKKSMVQKSKQKQMVQKRLPYYRLPVERSSSGVSMLNISQ